MSLRLTDNIRAAIVTRLMDHRFIPEQAKLSKQANELALKVYNLSYTAAERARMEALPEGWLATTHRMYCQMQDYTTSLALTQAMRIPFADQSTYHNLTKAKGGNLLMQAIEAHRAAQVKFEKDRGEMHQQIWATLNGFNTLKRLLEAWPEVKHFTDQLGYDDEKKSLPATIPTDLNAKLALPVKAKRAA